MKSQSVVVIGAGIGGITAAIHLAKHGLYVTVLEKNSGPGGRCDRLSRDGHHFDTGPTLFVMHLLYEAEFRALGASMHEQLDLQRVDPTCQLVFDNGTQLSLTLWTHCPKACHPEYYDFVKDNVRQVAGQDDSL
jgi:phytoene dehydrogenase-like protein